MLKYININNIARKELDITYLEYVICDMVYHLSNNPKSHIPGWCNMSRNTMAEETGLSRSGVIKALRRLEEKSLLKKNKDNYLKTTTKWFETVVYKVHPPHVQSTPPPMYKVHTISNKEDINIDKEEREEALPNSKESTSENHSPLKYSSVTIEDRAGAGAARASWLKSYNEFIKAFGVRDNTTLQTAAMRIDLAEWENITKHLPGYFARTNTTGNEGKAFRTTAIGYIKQAKWINDPNPVKEMATAPVLKRF